MDEVWIDWFDCYIKRLIYHWKKRDNVIKHSMTENKERFSEGFIVIVELVNKKWKKDDLKVKKNIEINSN